jgi:hypothetical protein
MVRLVLGRRNVGTLDKRVLVLSRERLGVLRRIDRTCDMAGGPLMGGLPVSSGRTRCYARRGRRKGRRNRRRRETYPLDSKQT